MAASLVLATDVQAAIGGRYDSANNRILFAAYHGFVSAVTLPTAMAPAHSAQLGNGFANPEDVLPARIPGTTTDVVYLSDRAGVVYEIDPTAGWSRAQAGTLVSGLLAPQQMALSNDGTALYVVEYRAPGASPGRLLKVPLPAPAQPVTVLSDVGAGVGVAVGPAVNGSDQIYLVEQGPGTLTRVDAASGTRAAVLATDLRGPFFLSWQDAARTRLLLPLRDPTNRVVQVDLTQVDAQGRARITRLLDGLPWRPSCAVAVAGQVVVLSDREITSYDLASGPRATVSRGMGGGGHFYWPRIDPAAPATMVMTSDMGALYRSTDSGATWSMLDTREVSGYKRFSAVFVPNGGGELLAAHKQRGLRIGTPTTTDPTVMTWADLISPPVSFEEFDSSRPRTAAYSPDGRVLLLGLGTAGIYRWDFTAGQSSWPPPFVPAASGAAEDLVSIAWADDSVAVAATEKTVYWSPDRGATWRPLEPAPGSGLPPGPGGSYDDDRSRILSLAVTKAGPGGPTPAGTIVVWVSTPRPGSAVYRCDIPPGATASTPAPPWQRIAVQQDVTGAWPSMSRQPGADSILFRRLAIRPDAPDTVHVGVAYVDVPAPYWSVLSGTRTAAGGTWTWTGTFDGFQSGDQSQWRNLSGPDVGWLEPDAPAGLGFGFGGAANGLVLDSTGHTLLYVNAACAYTGTVGPGSATWRQRYTQPVSTAQGPRWRTNGADVTTVWRYVVSPANDQQHYLASTDVRLARSDDAGDTWQLVNYGTNTFYDLEFVGPSLYAAVSSEHDLGHSGQWGKPLGSGEVARSDDGGRTWQAERSWPANPVTSLARAPAAGSLHAAVFGSGVWRRDGGTWAQLPSTGLPQGPGDPNASPPYAYQVDFDAGGRLLCLITRNSATDKPGAGLYRFDPQAASWTCLSQAVAAPPYYSLPTLFHPVSFTCHPADQDLVWLCTASVRGTNGPGRGFLGKVAAGTTASWTTPLTYQVLAPPPGTPIFLSVFSVAYDPADPTAGTVYAATESHGVWSSMNPTAATPTWQPLTGLPFRDTQGVAFDGSDPGTMYVTTFGGGAWRTMKPSYTRHWQQLIRRRAYETYLSGSGMPGSALSDWVGAERQLLDDAVRARAYELYVHRGRTPGGALEDWLRAEAEVVRTVTTF